MKPIQNNPSPPRPITPSLGADAVGLVHHGYDRQRDLPNVLPLWPDELLGLDVEGQGRLVGRLAALLRRERQRALAGEWGYDLTRHRQLSIAYRAELRHLRAVMANRLH